MRILNYGNDYAFQKRQKEKNNAAAPQQPVINPETKEDTKDAGDSIQDWREGTVAKPEEPKQDKADSEQKAKEDKKKQETRPESKRR